jgi:tripartite-type tricarboxylate transporter receptor subunit TctC
MDVEDNVFAFGAGGNQSAFQFSASWTEWKNQFRLEVFFETAKAEINGLGGSYGDETLKIFHMKNGLGIPNLETQEFNECGSSWTKELQDFHLRLSGKSGAGATIGATHVAQARPDGLTLLLAEQGGAALAHELHQDLPYDPRRSFAPIIWLVDLPMVLVVRPGLPAQTLPELLDLVRQRPGGLSYATVGVGHSAHLASEAMLSRLGPGAQMLPVTYRSGGDIMAALIKGEVDMNIASYASALSFLQAGAVRPLAVSTATRLPELPDVPTMAETLPGLTATLWYGLSGPVGMPPALVTEVNGVFNALLAIPELREAVRRQLAADPVGGPPERFADHLQAEITRWTPVVRAAAAKPQ